MPVETLGKSVAVDGAFARCAGVMRDGMTPIREGTYLYNSELDMETPVPPATDP
jgi:hypothetical protein